jgi:hypothetical protein
VIDDLAVVDLPERMTIPDFDGALKVQPFIIVQRQTIERSDPAAPQHQQQPDYDQPAAHRALLRKQETNRRDAEHAEKIKVKNEKNQDFRSAARGPIDR